MLRIFAEKLINKQQSYQIKRQIGEMAAKKNIFFQFSVINTHLKSKDYEFETHEQKICSLKN